MGKHCVSAAFFTHPTTSSMLAALSTFHMNSVATTATGRASTPGESTTCFWNFFDRAEREEIPTNIVADHIAEERLATPARPSFAQQRPFRTTDQSEIGHMTLWNLTLLILPLTARRDRRCSARTLLLSMSSAGLSSKSNITLQLGLLRRGRGAPDYRRLRRCCRKPCVRSQTV